MKIINTPYSGNSLGHYSPGVLSNGTLYISGQLPNNPETGERPEGIAAQTRACLENVRLVLEAAGLTKENVVMCRLFVADSAFWGPVNETYAAFFGGHRPARAIIPTSSLSPGLLIEIEAVAETGSNACK